ncbi:glycerol kinase GlpK [Oleiagrimonas sp. MCCC 1A03011]|uniref:glycerol kinase GlpK n=1 Tax=Oleiagrimonas sp. MCCC 1A03011 TaxID=1926883 RepID=UPI000DC4BC66|nr:glycerol kinase GlpK [Oleiagrimonas sp. MCCC 1A03011]RAP59738.1 glycerol kinase [Oleiagrimonas sp. MCCC 1A03011]
MSRERDHIVAIDQGTTSSRVMVFDAEGRVVGKAQREFEQIFPRPGWVEHKPREILTSVLVTLTEAMHNAEVDASSVAGIGITNQRETTVVWDRKTGEPVHNAIVWQSRHSAELCRHMRNSETDKLVRERTGLLIDAYFSATKIKWLFANVEGVRERAQKGELLFGTIDSWLVWNLTGGQVHVTDITNASRTLLYDIHRQRWDDDLLELFGVPKSMLPEVRGCSEEYGRIQAKHFFGHDVPICGIAGDQQAALFGQACFEPGMAKNTYGTGCFLLMHTGEEARISTHGLLTTPAWRIGETTEYALEGSVFVAGSVVQWLRDGLRMLGKASDSQAYAERAGDNDGVYMVPAFTGLGAPYWQSDVRGAIFGLSRGTQKEHFIRAALESMAYQTRDVLDAMQQDAGIELKELRADGGAIANDFTAQFQADILDVPVIRPKINETTALGAAYLAGLAAGVWRDREEIAKLWSLDRCFTPQMNSVRREALYSGWQRAVEATMQYRVED